MWKPSGGGNGSPVWWCELRGEATAGDAAAQRRAEVKALKRCCQQLAAHGALQVPAVMSLREEMEENIMSRGNPSAQANIPDSY